MANTLANLESAVAALTVHRLREDDPAGLEAVNRALDAIYQHPALKAHRTRALDEIARMGEGFAE